MVDMIFYVIICLFFFSFSEIEITEIVACNKSNIM